MRLFILLAGMFAASLLVGCRPAAVTTSANTGVNQDDKKEGNELLGRWKVERIETGGEREPLAEELASFCIDFSMEGKMSMYANPQAGMRSESGKYQIDPTAKPKTLDFALEGGVKKLGIYELVGDSLKICQTSGDGAKRPEEFKADGKGTSLITLKRVQLPKKK